MEADDSPWKVGMVVFVGLAIPVLVLVATGRFEPIQLLHPGPLGPSAAMIEAEFGPDVFLRDDVGYDGQQAWVVADNFPDLDAAAPGLDTPAYRLQRILQPALASVAGGGSASALALVVLTLAGTALCCACLADLAGRHGRPTALGYVAVVPLVFAIALNTTEPFAYGLGFLGLCFADRGRHLAAAATIALAALARESAALFAVAAAAPLAIDLLRRRQRFDVRWLAYALPVALPALWWVHLHATYEVVRHRDRLIVFGLVDGTASQVGLALLVLALCGFGTWWWRDARLLAWTAAMFGASVFVFEPEIFKPWIASRVVAPGITIGLAAIVGAVVSRRRAAPA